MLKITKVWYYTEYLGEWILQFYPILYTQLKVKFL